VALSASHEKIATALLMLGNSDKAITEYQAAINLREAACDANPKAFIWKHDLGKTYEALASALKRNGRFDEARNLLTRARSLFIRLLIELPAQQAWKKDVHRVDLEIEALAKKGPIGD
jgi:Flp pilus assembly protein TadD